MSIEVPTHESIRSDLNQRHAAFHDLMDAIPPDAWRSPTPNPAWTVGDLLHHLVWSLEELPKEVASARRRKGMYNYPGFIAGPVSAWYTRWEARNETPASVIERYDKAMIAVLDLLDQIQDHEWSLGADFWGEGFRDVEGLFRSHGEHLAEHEVDIRAALKSPDALAG